MRVLRSVPWFATAIVVAVLTVSGTASAQNRPKGPPSNREPAQGGGTIKGATPGGLEVHASGGDRYLVQIEPQARAIEYLATAEPSWLVPGMLVRFTATVDRRGKIQEPIDQLEVITLREGIQLGVVSDMGDGGGLGDEGAGLFQEAKPEKKEKKKAPPPKDSGTWTFVGRLTETKNGRVAIAVPGKVLKGELAENAKISVDYGNLSLVKPGDQITFQGWSPIGRKQYVMANTVTVTSPEKLVGAKKKTPKPEAAEGEGGKAVEKTEKGEKPEKSDTKTE
jgi:hypothetical protein